MHATLHPAGTADHTILLVEDDAAVRAATRRVLERFGYAVLEASNGREAAALLESDVVSVSLVITDMLMPEMNGLELADVVHARMPSVPMLFMSGYSMEALEQWRAVPPGSVFLQKPFPPSTLAAHVDRVLAGARPPGG